MELKKPEIEMKNATHFGIQANTLESFIAKLNAENVRLNNEGYKVFATQTAITPHGEGLTYTGILFYFKPR